MLREAKTCDLIYTLDWFAAGLPVALAAKLRGKPYVVRVGGDYLWEQKYLESGQKPVTLREFYTSGIYRRSGYAIAFRLIRFVLSGARHVVFNSNAQRELYVRFYGLAPARVSTIFNPVPEVSSAAKNDASRRNEFVYWGRFIVMKISIPSFALLHRRTFRRITGFFSSVTGRARWSWSIWSESLVWSNG